jgi:hypothetical protein
MTDKEALAWLGALRRLRAIEAEQKRHVAILERALKNHQRAQRVAAEYAGHVEAMVTESPVMPHAARHHLAGGPDACVERCSKRIAYENDEPHEGAT